jgi:hypothetical protein
LGSDHVRAALSARGAPIEEIQPGDFILANTNDGKPHIYQVHAMRIE